jgi:hypothetical protein
MQVECNFDAPNPFVLHKAIDPKQLLWSLIPIGNQHFLISLYASDGLKTDNFQQIIQIPCCIVMESGVIDEIEKGNEVISTEGTCVQDQKGPWNIPIGKHL